MPDPLPEAVRVTTHGRLHMGFLDLNGGLGRRFGSIGVGVDGLATQVTLRRAEVAGIAAAGPDAERAARYAEALCAAAGIRAQHRLTVEAAVRPHAGLGSGTQLALGVGSAVARLEGLEIDARTLATRLGRGRRSAIGIGAFVGGGFVLDGGKADADAPPPLLVQRPFPKDWRLVLLFDENTDGLSGAGEREAFGTLPPLPEDDAARLCRLALMQMLPALAEEDLERFGSAVSEIQRVVGDHFAPAQGGRYASPRVTALLDACDALGVAGYGQSSWGPTGFALAASPAAAEDLAAELERRVPDHGCAIRIHAPMNTGARVEALSGD